MRNLEKGNNIPEEKKLSPKEVLIESGIAERMIESIKKNKGTENPEITFGVEDCDFEVRKIEDPETKITHMQVIIEMPNLHPENREKQPRLSQAFIVTGGGSFGGANEQSLTDKQRVAIQNILAEQAKEQAEEQAKEQAEE